MSNEIKRLRTNARMSEVVIANGVVHLAGQVPDTANVSITEQTKENLARIDTLLEAAGVDRTRLVSANIWLSDPKHFAEFEAISKAIPNR